MTRAAAKGDAARLKELADAGYDLDKPDYAGRTPLMAAAAEGNVEAARALLDAGAGPNFGSSAGTPLELAARHGRDPVVALLLARGARATASALDAAQRQGHDASARAIADGLAAPAKERDVPALPQDSHGNLDPDAYQRMLEAARPRKKTVADVDAPTYRSADRPNDFAVVVGVENYSLLPSATHAAADAEAMRRHLLALGYPERNVVVLRDRRAVRSQLAAYLQEWLPRNAGPRSQVLFYFSGHGAPDPATGRVFLVPWDGDAKFLQSTAYPVQQLYRDLAALRAKRVVVVLDSCFSGAGGRSVLAEGTRPLVTKLESLEPPKDVTLLAAARGDEISGSYDEQAHGLYTYFLLKGLSEGKRSARAVHEFALPKVQDEARRQNREQTPVLLGEDAAL